LRTSHNLKLADPNYYIPGDVELLLGVSVLWKLLGHQQIQLSKEALVVSRNYIGLDNRKQIARQNKGFFRISTNAKI